MRVKKENIRSDVSPKATKKKSQNKPKDPVYSAYQKYIKSKEFKALRDKVLERDNYKCRVCGRSQEEIIGTKYSLQAHHSNYEHLGKCNEEEFNDLITLCNVCHNAMHKAPSNLKRFSDKTPILKNITPPSEF